MNDYTLYISLVTLTIMLLYILYKNIKKTIDGFSVNDVKRAIDKVGNLGKDIANLGNQLAGEIQKVESLGNEIGKLGNEIEKVAKYPAEIGEIIAKEVEKVAKEADKKITSSFNKAFDEIDKTANKAFDEIEDAANEVGDFATDAINEIYKVLKEIGDAIAKIPQQVADMAKKIFLDYIPKLFEAGWKGFKKYIIDPLTGFFGEITNVFSLIGDVFRQIIKVLMRIPGCVPIYFFDVSYEIVMAALKTILPTWLKDIFRAIYNYFINPIVIPVITFVLGVIKTILEFFGFNFNLEYYAEFRKKCYDFGPLNTIFKAFIEVFELLMKALQLLFKLIPFDKIIDEILQLFGGGGKSSKAEEPEPEKDYELVKIGALTAKNFEGKWEKSVNLPNNVMFVENIPYSKSGTIINSYVFKVDTDIENKKIIVSRVDEDDGWAADVYFKGYNSQFNQVIDSTTEAVTETVDNVTETVDNVTNTVQDTISNTRQNVTDAATTAQNQLNNITSNFNSYFSSE